MKTYAAPSLTAIGNLVRHLDTVYGVEDMGTALQISIRPMGANTEWAIARLVDMLSGAFPQCHVERAPMDMLVIMRLQESVSAAAPAGQSESEEAERGEIADSGTEAPKTGREDRL